MNKLALWLAAGLTIVVCAGTVTASVNAATPSVVTRDALIVNRTIDAQHPGLAIIINRRGWFRSVDSVCLRFQFAKSNPLDPGESIMFSPAQWARMPAFGSYGFMNGWDYPQYDRTVCVERVPDDPAYDPTPNQYLSEFADGMVSLRLVPEGTTSLTIDRLTVEITGETGR